MGVNSLQRYLGWSTYAAKRLAKKLGFPPETPVQPQDGETGNLAIRELLQKNQPFLAGRVGAVEGRSYLHANGYAYGRTSAERLEKQAGIFPATWKTVESYADLLEESVRGVDVLAVFGLVSQKPTAWEHENKIVQLLRPNTHIVAPKALEPYFFPNQGWWYELGNKRVLIVSSIASELKNRLNETILHNLWPKEIDITRLIPANIAAIDSPYGWDQSVQKKFPTYRELFENLKEQVDKQGPFDVALLACGGYGLPLAAWIKSRGQKAIHLGGVIQVWGGFRGVRFETMKPWKDIINSYWVPYPEYKVPQDRSLAEGHYWGK